MIHAPVSSLAKPIGDVPNYLRPNVRDILEKLGDFVYDEDEVEDSELPMFGPFIFENQAVYYGSWKNGMRHGRGV